MVNIKSKYLKSKEHKEAYDKILKEIGKAVVLFSDLELHLDFLLWNLLYKKPQTRTHKGIIVTSELSFKQKIYLFKSLLLRDTKNSKLIKETNDFAKILFQAEEKRNILLHSIWAKSAEKNLATRLKITAKEGLKYKFEELEIHQLEEYSKMFKTIRDDMKNLYFLPKNITISISDNV